MTPEYNPDDTICAISTPAGVGGIAVARVSGKDAIAIVEKIWRGRPLAETPTHTARFGTVTDSHGDDLDEAVATPFRGPRSYTGQDTVEISVHGSRYIQRELLASLIKAGARMALPGEFTRRAFANGKLDLSQAEGVADMIASSSRAAHRLAISQMKGEYSRRLEQLRSRLLDLASLVELELDFSEEEVEFADRDTLRATAAEIHAEVTRLLHSFRTGQAIKEGIPVAIIGATNAGKSSLLNRLIGDDRAIVSDIHGTTRDTVEECAEIGDYLFRFIDTAGLRQTTDTVERMGIERSRAAAGHARIVVLVTDATEPLDTKLLDTLDIADDARIIIVRNKSDLPHSAADASDAIELSALTGQGIDTLIAALQEAVSDDAYGADDLLVTNQRHAEALGKAAASTAAILDGLTASRPTALIALDIRDTIHHLSAITATATITSQEILTTIFSRYCIGK